MYRGSRVCGMLIDRTVCTRSVDDVFRGPAHTNVRSLFTQSILDMYFF